MTTEPGRHRLSIGIVLGSITPEAGGLFYSVRRMAQELLSIGHTVSVYAYDEPGAAEAMCDWAPLRPRLFSRRGVGSAAVPVGLASALVEADHDILHQHGIWLPMSYAVLSWQRSTRRPTVISPRGMLDPWALQQSVWKKRFALLAYEQANLRRASALHALNESEARAINAAYPQAQVQIIPNGVDPAPIDLRPDLSDGKTLLFLGRIDPKKGVEHLLRAWRSIAGRHLDWSLAIAGPDTSTYASDLKKRFSTVPRITWQGDVRGRAKARVLTDASAFVLPSFSEGQPMAVLEAWSAGCPVLMSEGCNFPDAFDRKEAIRLDPEHGDLATALSSALERDDLEEIGKRGKKRAERDHAWPMLTHGFDALYARLSTQGSAARARRTAR